MVSVVAFVGAAVVAVVVVAVVVVRGRFGGSDDGISSLSVVVDVDDMEEGETSPSVFRSGCEPWMLGVRLGVWLGVRDERLEGSGWAFECLLMILLLLLPPPPAPPPSPLDSIASIAAML